MAQMAKNAEGNLEEVIQQWGSDHPAKPRAIILWSSLASNAHQQAGQKRMFDKFKAMKLRHQQLDGSQPENKDLRSQLFNKSEVRGKYPQIFIETDDGLEYVGNDEDVQYLLDSETFNDKFKPCM